MRTCLVLAALAVGMAWSASQAADKEKVSIEDVMMEAHSDDGLLNKVLDGKSSKADREKLLKLYEALAMDKPPKGSPASWKTKTSALVVAAKAVVADPKAIAKLKAASDCKSCHSVHKAS